MKKQTVGLRSVAWRPLAAALSLVFLGSGVALAEDVSVSLSGAQEVPPVMTQASGSGTIVINADKTVSGSVMTKGVPATMAHIHLAGTGKNGPIIVPLAKEGEDKWSVPAGAKLTDEQYEAFKKGDLYVNVHSAAHPGGEIRAQLKP